MVNKQGQAGSVYLAGEGDHGGSTAGVSTGQTDGQTRGGEQLTAGSSSAGEEQNGESVC